MIPKASITRAQYHARKSAEWDKEAVAARDRGRHMLADGCSDAARKHAVEAIRATQESLPPYSDGGPS